MVSRTHVTVDGKQVEVSKRVAAVFLRGSRDDGRRRGRSVPLVLVRESTLTRMAEFAQLREENLMATRGSMMRVATQRQDSGSSEDKF